MMHDVKSNRGSFSLSRRPTPQRRNKLPRSQWGMVECLEERRVLAAPTLEAIPNVTLLGGAPLHIPLKAFDADGDTLTFSVSSTNPLLTGQISQNTNRSIVFNVSHQSSGAGDPAFQGQMIFELFEDLAPRTTARIIELAQEGFYDGLTFHRVAESGDGTPFVIQAGDPLGNGTGGTGVKFDDEFHPLLQHTSAGILSMANSGIDTNDSQFFVTATSTRFLDFRHSIFGFLVRGEEVRQQIQNVAVDGNDKPLAPVTIDSVEVFVDQQNGVLRIDAPQNFAGQATVTVTVSDGKGGTAQREFNVTIQPDNTNTRPFLSGYPDEVRVAPGQSKSFILEVVDVENDPVRFVLLNGPPGFDIEAETTIVNPVNQRAQLLVTVTPTTAAPGNYILDFIVFDARIPDEQVNLGVVDGQFIDLVVDPSASSAGTDTFGLFAPSTSTFFYKNTNAAGPADGITQFGPANANWIPLAGDWNGNGVDDFALFTAQTSSFFFKNTKGPGAADGIVQFGPAGAGWIPLVGDWNGDGIDTFALFEPNSSTFFIKNSNTPGPADVVIQFGPAGGVGWVPLAGDWDGDGVDTFALFAPSPSTFFFKNTNGPGAADGIVQFGPAGANWKPLAGDWNGAGSDKFGLFDATTSNFFFKNVNGPGPADGVVQFGPAGAGWVAIAGDWDGGNALSAAGGASTTTSVGDNLDQATLDLMAEAAIARWAVAGIDGAALEQLSQLQFRVADLEGAGLGLARPGIIYIDVNAAGYGWFVDPSPMLDEEFFGGIDGQLNALAGGDAANRIDLLTVLMHEMGNHLGFADLDSLQYPEELMSGELEAGARRLPTQLVIDQLFDGDLWA